MSNDMRVNSTPPVYSGFGGAVVGGIAGYIAAPRMYNLEQLLTLEPDTFTKEFSAKVMTKASKEQHNSMDSLRKARKAFFDARAKNVGDSKLMELKSSKWLSKDYNSLKSIIPKARAQSAVIGAIVLGVVAALGKMIFNSQNG